MPDHLHALPPGHMLGEYRIDRVLGSGGFGITYYAWDTHLDKPVAIKEYLPNEFAVRADATTVHPKSSGDRADYEWGLARFLDEARTLARFRHAHLNEVYRFFEGNGTAYMVLEYIDGETLSDILRRDGHLAPERLRRLLDELLTGLDEVHAAGYVHRDVKPGNIMLRTDGSAVLLDFGAARQAVGRRSKSVTSILTPGYAPIEQYAQTADMTGPWTDLYALGMVAYRCLSGMRESELPDAPTRALLQKSGKEDLRPAAQAAAGAHDDAMLRAVDWAIRMDESERPQSVVAMREMLAGTVVVAPGALTASIPSPSIPSPSIPAARPRVKKVAAGGGMNIGWKRAAPMLLVALVVGGVVAGLPAAVDWWDWRGVSCADEAQLAAYVSARSGGRYVADANACLAAIVAEPQRAAEAKAQRERFVRILGRALWPRAKDANGWTDLHYAAAADLHHVALHLIATGADVNARLKSDGEEISDSLKRNLRQLLGNTDMEDWHRFGTTPLHVAASRNSGKVAVLLLKIGVDIAAKNRDGRTPLHYAASSNADKIATLLLKNGADVGAKNGDGFTPLHWAAGRNADKTAALLLKNDANAAAKSADGYTPLHAAARRNADKIAALLLKNGADVATKDNYGKTPLHYAARSNAVKSAILLLKNGADVEAQDASGSTPLHEAAWGNADKTANLLLKNGADVDVKNTDGFTPLHWAAEKNADNVADLLLKEGADIAAKAKSGGTPLHLAAGGNADKTADLLLKNSANVDAKDTNGYTPLHSAAWKNADKAATVLLKNGANADAKNTGGYTPLHLAAEKNADKAATVLLKNGAKRYARNRNGQTPLDVARHKNSHKVIRLLQN